MQIIDYDNRFDEDIKDLLVELQEYVVSLDKYNLNILSNEYREEYFNKTYLEVKDGNGKIFLCIENDKAVGMIAGHIRSYVESDKLDYKCPKIGVIEELIVSKNARQGGIGTKLIESMENYFKEIDCEFVMLDVFAYNQTALEFYKRKGYEERMITLFKKV